MPAAAAENKAHEFAWIGTTLGEQLAAQLLARLPSADERLNELVQARKGQDDVAILRSALVALRTLPISFALDLQTAVEKRFVDKLSRLYLMGESRLGFTMEALSLVDDDQMREDIATSKAVQRMREDIGAEFYGLTRRLCHLTERDGIPDSENPGFPSTLVYALLDALREGAGSRDVLLAMFDAVMPETEQVIVGVYREVNAEMVRRGVLIEVNDTVIRHGFTANTGNAARTGESGAFAETRGDGGGGSGGSGGSGGGGGGSGVGSGGGAYSQGSSGERGTDPTQTDIFYSSPSRTMPGYLLVSAREHQARRHDPLMPRGASSNSSVPTPQPMTSDRQDGFRADRGSLTTGGLIALGFEQLKQDLRVVSAGTEVWNLLLPSVLRVAEHDESITTTDDFYVRQCIDRAAEFIYTQRLAPSALDGSYEALIEVAKWIGESSKTSARAFEMAAERLDSLTDQFESAAASAREETKTIAEFESMDAARAAAREAINRAFAHGEVPERIRQFADETAFDVLISDYLNGGREGELWQTDVETLNLLVASLRPIRSREQRAALTTQLPMIVSRLGTALKRTQRSNAELRAFLDDLKPLYEALAREETVAPVEVRALRAGAASEDPAEFERTAALAPMPNLRSVRWVAFSDAGGANEVRCRMNWQSPTRSTYLFRNYVDREYFALTMDELAQRFRGGFAQNVPGLEIATPYFVRT